VIAADTTRERSPAYWARKEAANAEHDERNRIGWLRHLRHRREWPVDSCRICADAPRDHNPYAPTN
jgi:hypothetical protein